MPYPYTPFKENFNNDLIKTLSNNTDNVNTVSQERYISTLNWLCTSPRISSYKVNSIKCSPSEVVRLIERNFYYGDTLTDSVYLEDMSSCIQIHKGIPNVIIINNFVVNESKLERFSKEVIVDVDCACAVLRGAHIYAPGIIGLSTGTQIGDKVSVYADIEGKCKRGFQKLYEIDQKVFIGNGIARMQRHQLFGQDLKPRGIGISMFETISGCPSLDDSKLPVGFALLQNLPSILCVLALNPQPGESVIDLCASPGNKTVHIAELMDNKGLLIAIDKTPRKVQSLKEKCETFGASIVQTFLADSTRIISSDSDRNLANGPPFSEESFDRVLLDAPCSVLGKRPQLANTMSSNEIKSFVPLQRKLIDTAVRLLKPNGVLVYSTCTITLAENEGNVAWTLKTFKNMKLTTPQYSFGELGWPGAGLTDEELRNVQRFGPQSSIDSVGFFFAMFRKDAVMSEKCD